MIIIRIWQKSNKDSPKSRLSKAEQSKAKAHQLNKWLVKDSPKSRLGKSKARSLQRTQSINVCLAQRGAKHKVKSNHISLSRNKMGGGRLILPALKKYYLQYTKNQVSTNNKKSFL